MLAAAALALAAFTPVVVHDARRALPARVGGGPRPDRPHAPTRAPPPTAAAVPARGRRALAPVLALLPPTRTRTAAIVRTGRHAGDWELVQFRVDAAGRPVEAVYAQHSGAERCGWREVERRGGRPVVYAAHGSHASYLHAGTRDRMWPDPNDEADGRGAVTSPAPRRDHRHAARRG